MNFTQMLQELATKISGGMDTSADGLRQILITEVNNTLAEVKDPAEAIGLDTVKALLFEQAFDYIGFDAMTDEQVADLTTDEALQRESMLAAHAAQMAVIAKAEAAYQANVRKVRAATLTMLENLAIRVGKFGLGVLGASLA